VTLTVRKHPLDTSYRGKFSGKYEYCALITGGIGHQLALRRLRSEFAKAVIDVETL